MKNYQEPLVEFLALNSCDIISTSGPNFKFEDGDLHGEIGDWLDF